jgi:hypothetical protein
LRAFAKRKALKRRVFHRVVRGLHGVVPASTNTETISMNQRLRQERNVFLLFLAAVFVSLMSALPIVTATLPNVRYAQRTAAVSVVTFEQLDRNRDGYVDRAEALALPGLDRVFNEADRRPDGRLDKVEYAKALALIDGPK